MREMMLVLSVAAPAVAPGAAAIVAFTGMGYYGTTWAMQDMGSSYPLPMEYESGAIQPTYALPESSTVAIDVSVTTEVVIDDCGTSMLSDVLPTNTEDSIDLVLPQWIRGPRKGRSLEPHNKKGNQGDKTRKPLSQPGLPKEGRPDPNEPPPLPPIGPPRLDGTRKAQIAFWLYVYANTMYRGIDVLNLDQVLFGMEFPEGP